MERRREITDLEANISRLERDMSHDKLIIKALEGEVAYMEALIEAKNILLFSRDQPKRQGC